MRGCWLADTLLVLQQRYWERLTDDEDKEIVRIATRILQTDTTFPKHAVAYAIMHDGVLLAKARAGTRSRAHPHLAVVARRLFREYLDHIKLRRRPGTRALSSVAYRLWTSAFETCAEERLGPTLKRVEAFLRHAADQNLAVWINVFFRSGSHDLMVPEGSAEHARQINRQVISILGEPPLFDPVHILTSAEQQHGLEAVFLEEGPLQHFVANLVGRLRKELPGLCVLLCFSG